MFCLYISHVLNILRCEENIKSRDTIKYIELVIRHSKNLRLVLLTANPMYNISSEIVWIVNMLLLNDNRSLISEKDIFDSDGNIKNPEYLKDKCKGYISYLHYSHSFNDMTKIIPFYQSEENGLCNILIDYEYCFTMNISIFYTMNIFIFMNIFMNNLYCL